MYKTHKEHKKRPFMNKTQILLFALGTSSAGDGVDESGD